MLVETGLVQSEYFDRSLQVLGELQTQATVEVMSRISGRLEQVEPYLGDWVEKGQLMAVLEDDDLQQQIRRQNAAIAVANAALNREEATVENLQLQLQRFEKLFDEELISLQDLEDMQSRLRVALSQQNLAAAQVDQAQALLRELDIQQEHTRIYASLSGFVGQRFLEPGAVVNPSSPILSILNLGPGQNHRGSARKGPGCHQSGVALQDFDSCLPGQDLHRCDYPHQSVPRSGDPEC